MAEHLTSYSTMKAGKLPYDLYCVVVTPKPHHHPSKKTKSQAILSQAIKLSVPENKKMIFKVCVLRHISYCYFESRSFPLKG
jgi:hypothetical protein